MIIGESGWKSSLKRLLRSAIGLVLGQWTTPGPLRDALDRLEASQGSSEYRGMRVLVWEPGGMTGILTRDGAIAAGLRLRGAETLLVGCDGAMGACVLRETHDCEALVDWPSRCGSCLSVYLRQAEELGLEFLGLGSLLSAERLALLRDKAYSIRTGDILTCTHRGVEVGEFATSSLVRYAKGEPAELHAELLREYLFAALVVTDAAAAAVEQLRPDYVLMSHGVYVDWGPALAVFVQHGIPLGIWISGYLENHIYLRRVVHAKQSVCVQSMSQEAWEERAHTPLAPSQAQQLDQYIADRYRGGAASDLEMPLSVMSTAELRRALELPDAGPVWCLFAHLNWDSVSDYSPMVFESIDDWLLSAIDAMAADPATTWLVKIHPAERQTQTVAGVGALIGSHFRDLPPNIKIIAGDADVSPLDLYRMLDGGTTIFGTAGLEMALEGKPVIVAGQPHYSGKGFTYDATSAQEYLRLIESAGRTPLLSGEQVRLARLYGYSYFIQRQIPLNAISGNWGPLDPARLALLQPGGDAAMDMICERIWTRGEFILGTGRERLELENEPR